MLKTQGSFGYSEEFLTEGSASVVARCANLARSLFVFGQNLLINGDFEQSTGYGATSAPAVGWTTQYTPSNNIFAAGAGTYAFFATHAGTVTGNHVNAIPVRALGIRSAAVNVGANTAIAIFSWSNIYLENGETYQFIGDVAIINNPYGVGLRIDGVQVAAMPAPAAISVWQRMITTFTFAGTTGYHTVAVHSNSGVAGGNDHCFDNFSLRKIQVARTETLTNVSYGAVLRGVADQIVKLASCNDDRRDIILADISKITQTVSEPTVESRLVRIGGAAAVTQTMAALLPSGKNWVSIGFVVLAGTASFVDSDGTVTTNRGVGFAVDWATDTDQYLSTPISITANANSQVAISYTLR